MKQILFRVDTEIKAEFLAYCNEHRTTIQEQLEGYVHKCLKYDREKKRIQLEKEKKDENNHHELG